MTWRSLALLALACSAPACAADAVEVPVTPFSTSMPGGALPAPWHIATLPTVERATRYALVAEGGKAALRAEADASMGSVVHPLKVEANDFPIIAWRWKISNVLQKAELGKKAGDDFPARVYVFFDYDIRKLTMMQRAKIYLARKRFGDAVPTAALCYVWDGKAPVGTSSWSPYTDRVRVIVAESGSGEVNRWREVRRDLLADFRAAYGEDPPPITGVAVASDTDNTGERVTAFFGDVRLLRR